MYWNWKSLGSSGTLGMSCGISKPSVCRSNSWVSVRQLTKQAMLGLGLELMSMSKPSSHASITSSRGLPSRNVTSPLIFNAKYWNNETKKRFNYKKSPILNKMNLTLSVLAWARWRIRVQKIKIRPWLTPNCPQKLKLGYLICPVH